MDDRVEFVQAFGKPYPSLVIASVMGAPLSDAPRLHYWSNVIQRQFDAAALTEDRAEIEQAVSDFYVWADALITERRRSPSDDLITDLITAEVVPALGRGSNPNRADYCSRFPNSLGAFREADKHLDRVLKPSDRVLIDNGVMFAADLYTTHPNQFVVRNDRDWQKIIANPYGTVTYILTQSIGRKGPPLASGSPYIAGGGSIDAGAQTIDAAAKQTGSQTSGARKPQSQGQAPQPAAAKNQTEPVAAPLPV